MAWQVLLQRHLKELPLGGLVGKMTSNRGHFRIQVLHNDQGYFRASASGERGPFATPKYRLNSTLSVNLSGVHVIVVPAI